VYAVRASAIKFPPMVEQLKKWSPDHRPALTAVRVSALFVPEMKVKIEVEALKVSSNKCKNSWIGICVASMYELGNQAVDCDDDNSSRREGEGQRSKVSTG